MKKNLERRSEYMRGTDYYWNVNKQSAHILKDIRDAFTADDQEKATLLTCKNCTYEETDEAPFRFGAFTTMGVLYVETGLSE